MRALGASTALSFGSAPAVLVGLIVLGSVVALIATQLSPGVCRFLRRLAESGIGEAADGTEGDRDIVVLTDKTPRGWLSRDDLRHPLAVVATSITLPVRGLLERCQWVDYRPRRAGTLRALGRDLAGLWGFTDRPGDVRTPDTLLRHEITRRRHEREYDEVNRAAADLAAATC